MHGRKRAEYKALQRDAKVAAKLAAKSVAWHALQAELLERRATNRAATKAEPDAAAATATTTLQLIEKAVSVNPDPLWLWNFRSELLVLGRTTIPEDSTSAAVAMDWETEQRVTQAALQANPKSYGAWHYRKRCLQQHLLLLLQNKKDTSTSTFDPAAAVLEQELALTSLFFQRDERNFHCWSYRRFVVSCCLWSTCISSRAAATAEPAPPPVGEWRLDDDGKLWMGAQISRSSSTPASGGETARTAQQDERVTVILEKEWAFTEDKIRDNFSNFSAFHYRSKLLPVLVERRSSRERHSSSSLSEMMMTMVASELELVLNAVFTEPDDQTAWWYQRFLLDFMTSSSSSSPSRRSSSGSGDIVAVAVNDFQDILQPHMDQLRELQAEYPTGKWVLTGVLQCLQHGSSSLQENTVAERCRILEKLIAIDPDRTGRYQYFLRQTQKEVEGTST